MLQIQTLTINCDKNLFSCNKNTSVYMIRDFRGPQNGPMPHRLSAPLRKKKILKYSKLAEVKILNTKLAEVTILNTKLSVLSILKTV